MMESFLFSFLFFSLHTFQHATPLLIFFVIIIYAASERDKLNHTQSIDDDDNDDDEWARRPITVVGGSERNFSSVSRCCRSCFSSRLLRRGKIE